MMKLYGVRYQKVFTKGLIQGYDLGWIELKASNKGEAKQKFLAKSPKDYVKFIDVVLISDNI